MAEPFQTFDKHGRPHRLWRFKYVDRDGVRRTGTGYATKSDTRQLALQVQASEHAIRKGFIPRPKVVQTAKLYAEAVAEYIQWGQSQGGYHGRPWRENGNRRLSCLNFWAEHLKLHDLKDLTEVAGKVDEVIRELRSANLAGQTIRQYVAILRAFCHWCIDRDYLEQDPLLKIQRIHSVAVRHRRALNVIESKQLLDGCNPKNRLLYETALSSGLRANELRQLRVSDVRTNPPGFMLRAEITKYGDDGFHPLPTDVVQKISSSDANKQPSDLLFFVPHQIARQLRTDLKRSGIPITTSEGLIDFHALRTTYITRLCERTDLSLKEIQTLARHRKIDTTFRYYARVRTERLSEIAETIGKELAPKASLEVTTNEQPSEKQP